MHSRRDFLTRSLLALTSVTARLENFASLGAAEVVAAIRSGQLHAETYAAWALQRLATCSELNSTTRIAASKVLGAARAVDRARSLGQTLGPLAGLPLLVKDNIDTVGFPTSAGTAALEHNYPRHNAPVVQRLLDAGALILAKTNMHELASGGTSSNAFFGPVQNPYAPGRISGGSSGGTAAAIAAGAGRVGLGTDTAGSVRIPSAFCGTVGLRPTSFGMGSGAPQPYEPRGVVPLALDLDTIGPMGRTVEDVILLDEVIQRRRVTRISHVGGKRLGIAREQWQGLDPEVERICQAAVARLQSAGAQVVDVTGLKDVDDAAMELFGTLIAAGNQHDLKAYLASHVPGLSMDELMARVRSADVHYWFDKAAHSQLAPAELDAARHERRRALVSRYVNVFSDNRLDVLVCPTEPVVAPPIRAMGDRFDDTLSIAGQVVSAPLAYIRNTAPSCVLGVPALSLPAGMSDSGLPVGLQLAGLPGADASLLGLAAAVQSILGPVPVPQLNAP